MTQPAPPQLVLPSQVPPGPSAPMGGSTATPLMANPLEPVSTAQLLMANPLAPAFQVPPGPSAPMGVSTVPPLMANSTGRSLASYFPDMKPVLLLAIAKHKFDPGQIFKSDPQLRDKPRDGHLQLSEACVLIKAKRDMSPKEYPSFQSLHDPLHIYFNILMHQLIASRNHQEMLEFAHGSSKYKNLHQV